MLLYVWPDALLIICVVVICTLAGGAHEENIQEANMPGYLPSFVIPCNTADANLLVYSLLVSEMFIQLLMVTLDLVS